MDKLEGAWEDTGQWGWSTGTVRREWGRRDGLEKGWPLEPSQHPEEVHEMELGPSRQCRLAG